MVDNQTQKRTNRALETREQETRPMTWKPASTLPVPQEQEGYKFRWIRRSMMGQEDPTNVSKKRREGWEPVRAEDHCLHEGDRLRVGRIVKSSNARTILAFGLVAMTVVVPAVERRRVEVFGVHHSADARWRPTRDAACADR